MNVSGILSQVIPVILQVSGLRASPLYSDKAAEECCMYSFSAGVPQGDASVVTRYTLKIKVICRRYLNALENIDKIRAALCGEGNSAPSWDMSGRVLAVHPNSGKSAAEPNYEYDAGLIQIEQEFFLYIRRDGISGGNFIK